MKRTIISCLLAVGLWLTAAAANTVTLTSVQGHPGDEVEIAVMLANTDAVTALEVLIPLGDMLQYVEGSAVLNTERSTGHAISAAAEDGKLKIFIYSMSLAPLKGSEGELCRFKVKVGKEPADYALVPEVVMSDASGKAIAATVASGKVTILSPKIQVTTPTIDYGRVPIRSTYTKTLTVKNVGNEPLEITGCVFDDNELSASPSTCTVTAGSTRNIVLTYAPMKRGAIERVVTIQSNAINPKAGKAVVKAQPYSVNELHVQRAEGASDEEVTIVLKMNNMEPIAGAQCSFTMPDQLVYVEGSAALGSRCGGTNHQVMGSMNGKKLTLFMYSMTNTALPEGDGELMTFRVKLDGTSGTYKLTPTDVVLSNVAMENMVSATSGNSVVIKSPKISANNTLDMGRVAVTEKATATYSVSNTGKVDLVISKAAFLAEGYAVETPLPLAVAAGKTQQITVSYNPKVEGAHKTTMQLYTNDPTCRMKSVAVSGTVYEPNYLLLNGEVMPTGYRVKFSMENYTDIVAVQMRVHWLQGMSTSMSAMKLADRLKNHSHLVTDLGNGVYQVLIYSLTNKPIAGNSGELFTLEYTADEDTEYHETEIRVDDVVLSNARGVNYASSTSASLIASRMCSYLFSMSSVGWGTLMLPFDADVPVGLTAYGCAAVKDGVTVLAVSDKLQANTPYIINGKSGKYSFTGLSVMEKSSYSVGALTGVFVDTQITEGYVLQRLNGDVAFYRVDPNAPIRVPAYRCYLNVTSASALRIRLIGPTGLDVMESDREVDMYDLSGRKVATPMKKGIYIVENRKVIIK